MENIIKSFFEKEKIKYYGGLELSECKILYERKLPKFTKSVCFFLIPYNVQDNSKKNVSSYAVPRDYHLYVKQLEERFREHLSANSTECEFAFFADNSPFCERTSAEIAGLGKIGKNGLLINSEYGSYTFIAAICLSSYIRIPHFLENFNYDICLNCENCRNLCKFYSKEYDFCVSEITQKKKITQDEEQIIKKHKLVWGCDMCQEVCPYNKNAKDTEIEFFLQKRIPYITKESISGLSDSDFKERAYSWRGRETIMRNLEIWEHK